MHHGERPASPTGFDLSARVFAVGTVCLLFAFLLSNVLIYWYAWPGINALLSHHGWLGFGPPLKPFSDEQVSLSIAQWAIYALSLVSAGIWVGISRSSSLRTESNRLSALAAYIVRASFWAVLLVGLADMMISFLRVENLLSPLVGQHLTTELGRPEFRAQRVHFPLIALAFLIAIVIRNISFAWLGLLVVIAEFQIVISRFVFSYEQAFMGDLVRFWYGALFLFASAYALKEEGHVRVDVIYAHFSRRGKALANTAGVLLLGLPLCWVILVLGTSNRGSSIISPILSYEISQSGFGMYVKYLMAAFMMIYAVSMIVQFCAYLLNALADLRNEPGGDAPLSEGH